MTDADSVGRHLAYLTERGMSAQTVYCRRRALTRLAVFLTVPLLAATPGQLAAWRASLRGISVASAANYTGHIRCFYAWAAAEEVIGADPAARLAVPRRPRRLPRPIAAADLLLALASAPGRLRAWIVLAAWAGLRSCEIAYLRAENIVLHAEQPFILISADATKGDRERCVPLCPFAARELAAAGLPSRGWAFSRLDGQPGPNRPWRVSQVANRFLHDAGISATLHQLRHWFGTESYRGSLDLGAVQQLMGHASPATTMGYVLIASQSQRAAVAALPVPEDLAAAG